MKNQTEEDYQEDRATFWYKVGLDINWIGDNRGKGMMEDDCWFGRSA